MHAAEELFYRSLKDGRNKEPLKALLETFEAVLCQSLEKNAGTPVIWKKNMPDQAGAIAMGKSMLTAFYESIDLSGYAVVEVELPLRPGFTRMTACPRNSCWSASWICC
jgi:hypothetical protein